MCAPNAKWSASEEAEMIDLLLEQKAIGNSSENGFKPAVWQLVVTAVELALEGQEKGLAKDAKACKARYQQLKPNYKIVQTSWDLSGFGWDEGRQMVTANEDIWEKYLKSHKEAQPFKKKLFPLFDRIAELCGDVIATGAEWRFE
ncbi:hypothetical protein K439DRAFT_1623016 [Ramaria rubella]|nr:hypothetical protein K439DRAFT_1623016 [Ramaria rubella]